VRFYTVWNEANVAQFLSPQYNGDGRPVSPHLYAGLYRAAYAGIKAGNVLAQVGIGETSSNGRLAPSGKPEVQDTLAPARFAQLLARERPALQFDAWSQHPYPTRPALPPTQKVQSPNVNLTQLG